MGTRIDVRGGNRSVLRVELHGACYPSVACCTVTYTALYCHRSDSAYARYDCAAPSAEFGRYYGRKFLHTAPRKRMEKHPGHTQVRGQGQGGVYQILNFREVYPVDR